jgi:hypothetical protein
LYAPTRRVSVVTTLKNVLSTREYPLRSETLI